METLVSYLSREQYGDAPFWPRRYSQEPMHRRTWTNYTSDMDFMWRYQINHMFNRYLGWQYIGRAGYNQDQGIDWSKFYGIPFLDRFIRFVLSFPKRLEAGIDISVDVPADGCTYRACSSGSKTRSRAKEITSMKGRSLFIHCGLDLV